MKPLTIYEMFRDVDKDAFEPTDSMRKLHLLKVEEYVKAMRAQWLEDDPAPSEEKLELCSNFIRRMMLVNEIEQWMHPLDAFAVLIGDRDLGSSPEETLEYRNAIRTAWGFSDKEWKRFCADTMGVGVGYLSSIYSDPSCRKGDYDALNLSPTAMYRHYDIDGDLLYIGISVDLKSRDALHLVQSPWRKYSVRTEIVWFENRNIALEAERDAIRLEGPIFNKMHVSDSLKEARQAKYLADRMTSF